MINFNLIFIAFGGIVIFYCLIWLILRWKFRIYYERFKNVKTVPGLPLPIGHGYMLMGKNTQELFEYFDDMITTHCDQAVKIWMGPVPTIVIANAYDINAVLSSPHGQKKSHMYRFLKNKTGLATAPVELWRPSRKMLNGTFNFKMLLSFLPIFNECSAKLVRNLQNVTDGKLFDCGTEIFICALTMACLTTLGFDLNLQEYENEDLLKLLLHITGFVTHRAARIWLYPDFIFNLTADGKQLDKMFKRFYRITTDIMWRKKTEYNAMTEEEKTTIFDEDDTKKPKIFINQILHMAQENNLSDEYIKEQVDTMVFAGSETSAGTIAYITLVLAMYPDIQEQVYQEIVQVTNGSEQIDFEMISKLNYTEMVIKETLRLYPVAPFLPRDTTGDITISNCTIPRDTQILISVYHLHRDKSIWGPNANSYNPNNFLPEKIKERPPASFIPFSWGPRNCIAMRYAMMSMKVMLCHLLINYKFTTPLKPNDLKFELHLTLKLINGFMVQKTARRITN